MTRQIVFAVSAFWLTSLAQSPISPMASPREIVERFTTADAQGMRLTPEGRRRMDAFLVSPFPEKRPGIMVVSRQAVGPAKITGEKAEVWTEFAALGKIDRSGKFGRIVGFAGGDKRFPVIGPAHMRQGYTLNLTNQHEWRIDNPLPVPESQISVQTALRYLAKTRDETNDKVLKANLQRSIAALKKIESQTKSSASRSKRHTSEF